MLYSMIYNSPLGQILLLSDGTALTGLDFEGHWPNCQRIPGALPVFAEVNAWLDAYFRGENPVLDLPLHTQGTPFQQQVWQLLLNIPYGEIRTYGDLAREMARLTGKAKMSAQAVGQAVGRNPISILIPCHRVVGARGEITGYAGGIEKKQWLLRHEGRQIENHIVW